MTDMLATGSAWLEGKRKDFATSTVTIRRGKKSASVLATKGRSQFETDSLVDVPVVQRIESDDWLIDTADYDFGDGAVLPDRGDKIEQVDSAGRTFVYQVVPFGVAGGQTHWRYSDPYRQTLRIHTKHVDTIEP